MTPTAGGAPGSRRSSIACARRTRATSAGPVPPFGAADARARDRRARAGHARCQRERASVHRRPRRNPAVRHAPCVRLRVAAIATARGDGLALVDCRITNAVKCLPPENKPAPAEIRACNGYLAADLARVPDRRRHPRARPHRARRDAAALGIKRRRCRSPTARGMSCRAASRCSTAITAAATTPTPRRLTAAMFDAVFDAIAAHLGREGARAGGLAPSRSA